jgi:protein-disulfide isomerase
MNTTAWGATLAMPVRPERDHIRGPAGAATTVVEYGDYECPYCRVAHGIVAAVQARLQDRICFVFRHFPLTTVHPHAQPAAEAAEAAGRQHRFWPMHDTLFTTQALTDTAFMAAARAFGLNVQVFSSELTQHVHVPRIREDFMSGVRSGVNGTPAFYINGVRHDGAWDFETLLTAVNQASLPALKPAR